MSRPRAPCAAARRRRTASPRRCGWRNGSAPRRCCCPARTSPTRIIDYARANNVTHIIVGKSRRPRWRELLRGSLDAAADQPRRRHQRARHRGADDATKPEREARPAVTPRFGDRCRTRQRRCWSPPRSPVALVLRQCVEHLQHRAGVPDRDAGQRRVVRPAARRCWPAWSACWPTISSSCRRSTPSPSPIPRTSSRCSFSRIVAVIASNLAARVRGAGDRRPQPRQDHRGSVSVQPQAGRRGHAGRPVVGHRAPDRDDAESARRAAAARGRQRGGAGAGFPPEDMLDDADLAAAKWAWEKNRPAGRGSDTLPGAQVAVPADAHRPQPGRRGRHHPRRSGAAADARPAAAVRRAARPGGAGDRAREPGRAIWTRRGWRRRRTGCAPRC